MSAQRLEDYPGRFAVAPFFYREERDLALEDYNRYIRPWKNSIPTLTDGINLATKSLEKIQVGFYAMFGLSVWSTRNHPLLMLANASAAIALGIFYNTISHYVIGFYDHSLTIHALNIQNIGGLSERITQNYEAMGNQIWTVQRYLTKRKSSLEDDQPTGLKLLIEDMQAIEGVKLCSAMMQVFKVDKRPVALDFQGSVDLNRIQTIFRRLEGIADRVRKVTFEATVLGVGYLSLAYWDRARVMLVAGALFTVASGVLCSTAHCYKVGAKAMLEAGEDDLTELFNQTMARRFLPKVADTITLQHVIALPLEDLLKVIPLY